MIADVGGPVDECGVCLAIEKGAYRFLYQDHQVELHMLPIKQRVEPTGGKFVLYISYDLRSRLTKPFLPEPEGHADIAEAFGRHLKEVYDLEPDYWSVLNEPANGRPGDPVLCARMTAAVGKRRGPSEAGLAWCGRGGSHTGQEFP